LGASAAVIATLAGSGTVTEAETRRGPVVAAGGSVAGVVGGVAPLVLVVVRFGGPAAGWLLQAASRLPVATSSTAGRESRRANDGRTVSMAFSIAGRPPAMTEGPVAPGTWTRWWWRGWI
jgi:hypothetical protein